METNEFLNVPLVKLVYIDYKLGKRPKITQSSDVVRIALPLYEEFIYHHEEVYALLLNQATRVLGIVKLGEGTVNSSVANLKALYQALILSNATACILVHNHPSGNEQPSEGDKFLTKCLQAGLKVLDLRILDHVILTPIGKHYSFSDEGVL